MTALDRTMSVAQTVLEHPECAKAFHDHRIDFYCRGALSVTAACAGKGIDADAVFADLERTIAERAGAVESDPRTIGSWIGPPRPARSPPRDAVPYPVG